MEREDLSTAKPQTMFEIGADAINRYWENRRWFWNLPMEKQVDLWQKYHDRQNVLMALIILAEDIQAVL